MGVEGLLRESSIALERVGCSPHWSACSRTGVPARRPHWSASSAAALECQQLIGSGVISRWRVRCTSKLSSRRRFEEHLR